MNSVSILLLSTFGISIEYLIVYFVEIVAHKNALFVFSKITKIEFHIKSEYPK